MRSAELPMAPCVGEIYFGDRHAERPCRRAYSVALKDIRSTRNAASLGGGCPAVRGENNTISRRMASSAVILFCGSAYFITVHTRYPYCIVLCCTGTCPKLKPNHQPAAASLSRRRRDTQDQALHSLLQFAPLFVAILISMK